MSSDDTPSMVPTLPSSHQEARQAGWWPDGGWDHRHRIRPGAEPAGMVEGRLFWRAEDIELMRSKKGWKKYGRRVKGDARPLSVIQEGEYRVALFAFEQTESETEFRKRQQARLSARRDRWQGAWDGLLASLAAWQASLPNLDPAVAEGELAGLIEERATALGELSQITQAAENLGLVPPLADDAPWLLAMDAWRKRRNHIILAEGALDDEENFAQVVEELTREERAEGGEYYVLPYWKYYGRLHKAYERRLFEQEVAQATRIREFHELFPSRDQYRAFTLFLGPTNSGKTYQALLRMKAVASGVYLAPLRLLALEVAETLNAWGIPCNMVTGEERIMVPGARHTASTIEMLNLHAHYDLCVIDEAQMLGDADRGWAWTQAILGVRAKEVCVVGAPEGLPAIEKLLKLSEDPYQVVRLERMTPLSLLEAPIDRFEALTPGTALIAFSRHGVLGLKRELERRTGKRAAVVYGALPPEARRLQAQLFASGEAPFLVATDAIGMGLNLPIETLLFTQDSKLIDREVHPLTPMEARQIGGRAGRFGKNEMGFIGTFRIPMKHLREAFARDPAPITRAHLAPNLDHLLALAALQGEDNPNLARLFSLFTRAVKPDPAVYRHADLSDQTVLARISDRQKRLSLPVRFALSAAPVPLRDTPAVKAYEAMVETVARDGALSLGAMEQEVLGADSDRHLMGLEVGMKVVNLYCWVHYRFPDNFPDIAYAEKRRRQINARIDDLLSRNDPPAESQDQARRPRRSWGRRPPSRRRRG